MNKELKYYNAAGEQAPAMYLDKSRKRPTWIINPAASEDWRNDHGFIFTTKPIIPTQTPEISEEVFAAFKNACVQFRLVCDQIAIKADLPNFTGGFDEMLVYKQTPIYSTVEGVQLATDWIAANELCKYEGSKLGYTQPGWWYRCWDYKDINAIEEEANAIAIERHKHQSEGRDKEVKKLNKKLLKLWEKAQKAINRYEDVSDIKRQIINIQALLPILEPEIIDAPGDVGDYEPTTDVVFEEPILPEVPEAEAVVEQEHIEETYFLIDTTEDATDTEIV